MNGKKLSPTSISLVVYSIYLGVSGAGMALIPNVLLGVLGLSPVAETVWIRLFGSLAFVLAAKGTFGALRNLEAMMQFDVYTRIGFALFLTLLLVLGVAPRILSVFAVLDFAGAIWTEVTIRAARRRAPPALPTP
jgi:hypothetical protein